MIKTIIRLKNGMVMVFNEEGEQIPEFQGQYEEVKESIQENAPSETIYNHWLGYDLQPEVVSKNDW